MLQPALRAVAFRAVTLALAACALAACVGVGAPPSTPLPMAATPATSADAAGRPVAAAPTAPATGPVQATVISRSLWPGPATVLFAFEDATNAPVGGPEVRVRVAVLAADDAAGGTDPLAGARRSAARDPGPVTTGGSLAWATARYQRLAIDGRGLYAADLVLPAPGRVTFAVEVAAFGLAHRTRTASQVRDPGHTPALGAAAPRTDTPTYASADGDLARVTTDPIPDRRLYWLSVRRAIDEGRPIVLVLDSFAFRPSPACGGALGIVHHLADEYPSVSFIHAEAYATRVSDGRLVADPVAGPLRPAAWTAAWGVTTAPWVFVVDRSGIVRAKFSGIVGTDEIRDAIRSVAGWVPTY